jgi:hypothetical protein
MRRLLMRVFSNSFGHGCTLGRSWAIEEAQEQVDRNTPVSRTPTIVLEVHPLIIYTFCKSFLCKHAYIEVSANNISLETFTFSRKSFKN